MQKNPDPIELINFLVVQGLIKVYHKDSTPQDLVKRFKESKPKKRNKSNCYNRKWHSFELLNYGNCTGCDVVIENFKRK